MAVHSELGCGFLEAVYRAALQIEFRRRRIEAIAEVSAPIKYKGERLPLKYCVDFICKRDVLVEVKALSRLGPVEESQILNYLKLSGKRRALLLNFGSTLLEHRRFVW